MSVVATSGNAAVKSPMILPKISVVTPSFNQAAFLEQTITSVLGQEYPNLEYIVIDGGSTDGSVEIIRKYEKHLAYWVSEKDRGQTHAINKGLERSTGDLLAYLNSDDYYLPGTLKQVAEFSQTNPEADLIHGRCQIVDTEGHRVDQRVASIHSYEEILDLWRVWWNRRNFVQPEVFWTRRIMEKIGMLREELHWVMDYEYWLRILRAGGRVGTIDSELACFRLQAAQKSAQSDRVADEELRVLGPYLWEPTPEIPRHRRRELRADWLFDALFRKAATLSLEKKESKAWRWLRLSRLALRHPSIFFSAHFRSRVRGALRFA